MRASILLVFLALNLPHEAVAASHPVATVLSNTNSPGIAATTVSLPTYFIFGDHAWGDYDNDGDLDLLVTGSLHVDEKDPLPITYLYRNDGNYNFTLVSTAFTQLWKSHAQWGDYDNDGWLDLLLQGQRGSEFSPDSAVTELYHNNGNGTFTLVSTGLPNFRDDASLTWADFDNDGRLDVAIAGPRLPENAEYAGIFHNNGDGTFTDIHAGFLPVLYPVVLAADLDSDGDLDLAIQGYHLNNGSTFPAIYRNDLPPLAFQKVSDFPQPDPNSYNFAGALEAADFNNDGRLDLFDGANVGRAHLLRNNGNFSFDVPQADTSFNGDGGSRWGDFDNDGRADLLAPGGGFAEDPNLPGSFTILTNVVFHNDNDDAFSEAIVRNPAIYSGAASWADVDNDGDLDFMYSGRQADGSLWTSLFLIGGVPANTAPPAPTGLSAGLAPGGGIRLSWNPVADAETPAAGLTYNIRVGTSPGGQNVLSPMSDPVTGYRRVVRYGNVQRGTSWVLYVPVGTYYWSVQAVDGAYAGGAWAAEGMFTQTVDVSGPVQSALRLSINGGNPVSGRASFGLSIPRAGHARLRLYDTGGREVATLFDGELSRGTHDVAWERPRAHDAQVSGVYFARLEYAGQVRVVKAVVL